MEEVVAEEGDDVAFTCIAPGRVAVVLGAFVDEACTVRAVSGASAIVLPQLCCLLLVAHSPILQSSLTNLPFSSSLLSDSSSRSEWL